MRSIFRVSSISSLAVLGFCATSSFIDAAFAFGGTEAPAWPAPAPLIGLGIPAVAAVVGAVSVLRYLRQR